MPRYYITIDGKTQSMKAWAEHYGISYGTVVQRVSRGWTPEEAVSIPAGETVDRYRENFSKQPEYKVWQNIRGMCHRGNHPLYQYYGAKGIRVCDEWRHNYTQFIHDMGRRPSAAHQLSRKNKRGWYSKKNCRWVVPKQQKVAIDGEIMTINEAAKLNGLSPSTVEGRINKYGWDAQTAATKPARVGSKKIPIDDVRVLRNFSLAALEYEISRRQRCWDAKECEFCERPADNCERYPCEWKEK